MAKTVAVLDYGVGNLLSVQRAFEICGVNVILCTTPKEIAGIDHLVVPGVGAFGNCITALRAHGFEETIKLHAAQDQPLMGICVGMQMMLDSSSEFGEHSSLGLIPGVVKRISMTSQDVKIPNIGWEQLRSNQPFEGTILSQVSDDHSVYFLHSYAAHPHSDDDLLAYYELDGERVSAAVRRGNTYGLQFHPEKSGEVGLGIIREFLRL